jgi:hypothetical protein
MFPAKHVEKVVDMINAVFGCKEVVPAKYLAKARAKA